MPITQSAKKALKGSQKKREFNIAKKELLNKTIKKVKKVNVLFRIRNNKFNRSVAEWH